MQRASKSAPDPQAVSLTAYYCCGVRAADARSARPVCGDTLAEAFMDERGQRVYETFANLRQANATNAVRHRLIDDLLRERLRNDPLLQVLVLGAGFDTRAFRLTGGLWTEIDQPTVIEIKERVLPSASAPNSLRRVSIDFARERLADKLDGLDPAKPTVVVMEGVSMYLTDDAFRGTAQALIGRLPGHPLICDLFDGRFVMRFGSAMRQRIIALGGDFAPAHDDPVGFVESLGYRRVRVRSLVSSAVDLGALPVPHWLLATFLKSLRDGYLLAELVAR